MHSLLLVLFCTPSPGCSLFESKTEKAERFFQSGLAALEADKLDEAEIHFQNALQKNPYHAKAHHRMGILYIQKKQLYLAVRELNTAVKQDPALYDAKQALIQLSYQTRGFERAISLCEDFTRNKGNDLGVLTIWGDSLLNLKRGTEAVQVLRKAVEAFPNDPSARIYMAKALLSEKQKDEATRMMENAARLRHEDISIRIALARFYETITDQKAAEDAYSGIRSDFSKDPTAHHVMAQYYLRRGRLDEAQGVLSHAFSLNLQDSRFHRTLAQIHHFRNDFGGALRSFQSAVSESEGLEQRENLLYLADYYTFLRNRPMAISTYERILEKWPGLLLAELRMVELLIAENKDEQAMAIAEKVIAGHAENPYGHLLRGLLHVKGNNIPEARKEFDIARNLAPDLAESHYYYGLTFLNEGDYRISLSEISTALDKDPASWAGRLALAYIYFKTGKAGSSLEILDKILGERPENLQARLLRGSVHQRLGNHERASADFGFALERDSDLPEAEKLRMRLADTYQSLGKPDKALDQLSMLMNSGDTYRPLERMVRIHMGMGDYGKALDLCNTHLEKDPGNTGIALLKSEVLIRHGSFENAKEYISGLLEKNPRAYFLMGKLNQKHGRLEDSIAIFQAYNQRTPKNIEGFIELANTHQFMGKLDKAAETYEEFLKLHGFSASIGNDLAYLYAESGRNLDRALELANQARKAMPDSPGIADTLGWVHVKRKGPVLALKYLEEAARAQPDSPLILYHLGVAEFEGNHFTGARKRLQEAIRIGLVEKEKNSAAAMLAKILSFESAVKQAEELRRRGELEKAIQVCEELLGKAGFHPKGALLLARLYADTGKKLDRALEIAEKCFSHDPNDPDSADSLGWVYLKRGSALLAKKHFDEAIRLDPKKPLFHYHLGIVLNDQKDFSEARKAFRKAVDLGLDGKQAEHAIKMLERKGDGA